MTMSPILYSCPQKKKNSCPENSIPMNTIKKPVLKPVETDKKKQVHNALMDEFKKMHRKMFLGQESNENKQINESEDAESMVSYTILLITITHTVTPASCSR